MKIYYKTALDAAQIRARKKLAPNMGCEIHLSDWNIKEGVEVDAITIHAPINNRDYMLSSFVDNHLTDEWKALIIYAEERDLGIVIHNDLPLDDWRFENKSFWNLISNIKCSIHIENSTKQEDARHGHYNSRFGNIIPEMCKKLNERAGREVFFPLLDICHVLCDANASIENTDDSLKHYIHAFNSKKYILHLSYATGMGVGINHGDDFSSNIVLLDAILNEIYKVNKDAHIILEVRDNNPNKPLRLKRIIEQIEIIKSGNPSLIEGLEI